MLGSVLQGNRDMLTEMTIKRVSLRGRKNDPVFKQRWYKMLQHFRAGIERTINVLKRQFGLNRSLYKGTAGNQLWTGLGIMRQT
jgi:IS5 family transposase